ncbi:MAG: cell division protein ZapA [Candidatus Firestonebacteria bacterium]
MSQKNVVKVEIYGIEYLIKGDADPEYITQLAKYVDSKIREIVTATGLVNMNKITILSALNIADEYFKVRQAKEAKELQKTSSLLSLFDSAGIK